MKKSSVRERRSNVVFRNAEVSQITLRLQVSADGFAKDTMRKGELISAPKRQLCFFLVLTVFRL